MFVCLCVRSKLIHPLSDLTQIFVCFPIIIQEPLDQFASNFDRGTQWKHENVHSLVLIFQIEKVDFYRGFRASIIYVLEIEYTYLKLTKIKITCCKPKKTNTASNNALRHLREIIS